MKMANPFLSPHWRRTEPKPEEKHEFPFGLPAEIIQRIEKAIEAAIPRIKLQAECEANNFDHVMLVAMPAAKDAIEPIIFEDAFMSKYHRWVEKWFEPIDPDRVSSCGHTPLYEVTLVKHYAEKMVRHYRPE
jgi:hypothetical protein